MKANFGIANSRALHSSNQHPKFCYAAVRGMTNKAQI
jgi:hypothetical protein